MNDSYEGFVELDEAVVDLAGQAGAATVLPLRPDASPALDDVAVTAGRGSQMAVELAALADQMAESVRLQDRVLAGVSTSGAESGQRLRTARRVGARVMRALVLIRDQLGEQHVELCELGEQLDQLLPGTANPAGRADTARGVDTTSESGWAA